MSDAQLRRAIEQLATQGDREGSLVLGMVREYGWLCDKNAVIAEHELQKAAHAGSRLAHFMLARILARRDDHQGALEHAVQAAEGGLAEAAIWVATHHAMHPKSGDIHEVRRWYRIAMDLGHPMAPYHLALTFQNKHGDFTDEQQALQLFGEALNRGCKAAEHHVGILLLSSQDNDARTEGLLHLQAAAADDQLFALRELSRIYRDGLYGVTKSDEQAEKYAQRAEQILPVWMKRVSDAG